MHLRTQTTVSTLASWPDDKIEPLAVTDLSKLVATIAEAEKSREQLVEVALAWKCIEYTGAKLLAAVLQGNSSVSLEVKSTVLHLLSGYMWCLSSSLLACMPACRTWLLGCLRAGLAIPAPTHTLCGSFITRPLSSTTWLPRQVIAIDLSCNCIADAGATAIAAALRTPGTVLERLQLSQNEIGE